MLHYSKEIEELHRAFLSAQYEWADFEFIVVNPEWFYEERDTTSGRMGITPQECEEVCSCQHPAYPKMLFFVLSFRKNAAAFARFKERAAESWTFLPKEFKKWKSEYSEPDPGDRHGQWLDLVFNVWAEESWRVIPEDFNPELVGRWNSFSLSAEFIDDHGLARIIHKGFNHGDTEALRKRTSIKNHSLHNLTVCKLNPLIPFRIARK